MSRKRGKLSAEEEQFIRDNVDNLSIHQIAVQLNRTDETIEKYCSTHNLTHKGMSEEHFDDTVLRARLVETPYWSEVKEQLTDDEQEYFAITWIRMMKQFKVNILYSEELQIKQWITLEIMGNRVMRERKHAQDAIMRLEKELSAQYSLDAEVRDGMKIAQLETELGQMRMAQGSYTTEHSKILDHIKNIQKDLRATRADRIKKIEDSQSTWSGFLAALEDEDERRRQGELLEINRMAKDKAIERLSEWHEYEDGQVDQPFLTPDTIRND